MSQEVESTLSALEDAVKQLGRDRPDILVIAGGDSTVHQTLSKVLLEHERSPAAPIPQILIIPITPDQRRHRLRPRPLVPHRLGRRRQPQRGQPHSTRPITLRDRRATSSASCRDGRVASWRHAHSLLGRELDSLADVISSGVAPAALASAAGKVLVGVVSRGNDYCREMAEPRRVCYVRLTAASRIGGLDVFGGEQFRR